MPLACLISCVGEDLDLMSTRLPVMERAGYRVMGFNTFEFVNATLPPDIALLLLCHTLTEVNLAEVLSAVRRKRPGLRLLRLEGGGRMPPGFPDIPMVSTRPEDLVAAVRVALKGQRAAAEFN